jgi:hypothetical protein
MNVNKNVATKRGCDKSLLGDRTDSTTHSAVTENETRASSALSVKAAVLSESARREPIFASTFDITSVARSPLDGKHSCCV